MSYPLTPQVDVPFVDWDGFKRQFRWLQGEHVALIGPTGGGKTTLALNVLPVRDYVTVLATKPRDKTLDRFAATHDYKVMPEWKHSLAATKHPRRVLWPDARDLYAADKQREVFQQALSSIYVQGSWCVYMDELWIMSKTLRMDHEVKTFLQQGRSMDISLVVATQRPAWIPLEVYDQSTHLFFWLDNDETNLNRISGIGYQSSNMIKQLVCNLRRHEVLYINTRDNTMIRTMAPSPDTLKLATEVKA